MMTNIQTIKQSNMNRTIKKILFAIAIVVSVFVVALFSQGSIIITTQKTQRELQSGNFVEQQNGRTVCS